ncbi:MAG: hypothetical protein H6R25_2833 [Proteobacteria bacterium]|nr:hypothetical protein [Pseudomonadota bacterium]
MRENNVQYITDIFLLNEAPARQPECRNPLLVAIALIQRIALRPVVIDAGQFQTASNITIITPLPGEEEFPQRLRQVCCAVT